MGTQQLPLGDEQQPVYGEKMLEAELPAEHQPVGHPHFLQRAFSRRNFVRTAAGATGIALGAGVFIPVLALAGNNDDDDTTTPFEPRPIPGGIQPLGPGTPIFHTYPPGLNNRPLNHNRFQRYFWNSAG